MAEIVTLDRNASHAAGQIAQAIDLLRNGLAKLERMDGLRAQSIAESPAVMASNFGVENDAEAQALSDRIAALLAAYNGGTIPVLSDLIDAITTG